MKLRLTTLAVTAVMLLVPANASAQAASPKYDPATEVTMQGKIPSIHDRECPVSGTVGAHFMLEATTGKVYTVHLAPVKFSEMFDMVFAPGEKVAVTGHTLDSRGRRNHPPRVKHGNKTVTFRDKKGNPSWN